MNENGILIFHPDFVLDDKISEKSKGLSIMQKVRRAKTTSVLMYVCIAPGCRSLSMLDCVCYVCCPIVLTKSMLIAGTWGSNTTD